MTANSSVCGSSSDSPLSITANVVGIITFFLTASATYFAFLLVTSGALDEIERFRTDLEHHREQTIPLLKLCILEKDRPSNIFKMHESQLEASLKMLHDFVQSALAEITSLPKFDPMSRNPIRLQIRRRLLFARKRQYILEKIRQISNCKTDILMLQLTLLLW
jgi:hypothetical protein